MGSKERLCGKNQGIDYFTASLVSQFHTESLKVLFLRDMLTTND